MKNLTEVCWFYNISNKTLTGAKPMSVTFNKVKEFIRVYDGFRCFITELDILQEWKAVIPMVFLIISHMCYNQYSIR